MANYVFSPKTNSFYRVSIKATYEAAGSWPEDGIEVEDDVFNTYSKAPPSVNQMRSSDANGAPCWIDIPK